MSISNRDKGFAAGLVVATLTALSLLAISAALWGILKQAEYEREAERSEAHYDRNTYAPTSEACLVGLFIDQANCIADADRTRREYQRDERDLVAQRTMAVWTFLMGSAAIFGVILSLIGIFLIWTTFRATREGNLIAKEIGEIETRPWLLFEASFDKPATLIGGNISHEVDFVMRNYGKTPALSIFHCADVTQKPFNVDHGAGLRSFLKDWEEAFGFGYTIGAGDSGTEDLGYGAAEQFVERTANGYAIAVYAFVVYCDHSRKNWYVSARAYMVQWDAQGDALALRHVIPLDSITYKRVEES